MIIRDHPNREPEDPLFDLSENRKVVHALSISSIRRLDGIASAGQGSCPVSATGQTNHVRTTREHYGRSPYLDALLTGLSTLAIFDT